MTVPLDALIIGAGISGMYQLHLLRSRGLQVKAFEAGDNVGGTWYWNRYLGARFDSESYSYGYSFSKEILENWEWSEHFSPQPETLRYLNFVADRLDLRRDIHFGVRVIRATWQEDAGCWEIELNNGETARGRLLISAIGALSAPTLPNIPGVGAFKGPAYHTGLWPHEPVDFRGKRVAVIGTGATAVQLIQEVAKTAHSLTIFQRRPNWCAPLKNSPIDAASQQRIKASYSEIFARCAETHGGFLHGSDPRNALEVSEEERLAVYERLYNEPGFGIWMGNFRDILIDEAANATISEFVAQKIRERVRDPELAEKLIPRDHGFGTRRVPLETGYYEVYNQPNVELVDLRETPIERITELGIATRERDALCEREFDILIYATGFDAVTGAFDRIDIRGRQGLKLRDKWSDGPSTLLGIATRGFPNLLTLVGPHNAATFCNMPRCIEQNVEWVTALIEHMRANDLQQIEPSAAAEAEWTAHVHETAERMLFTRIDSWFMGINSNVPGKQQRHFLVYAGGAPNYRDMCDEEASSGYRGFEFA